MKLQKLLKFRMSSFTTSYFNFWGKNIFTVFEGGGVEDKFPPTHIF